MLFYVHGHDRPGAQAGMEALAEAHWSYMDRFGGGPVALTAQRWARGGRR